MTRFETTSWTLVLDSRNEDSSVARVAIARLCERYWLPLYAYCRRRGYRRQDAEELTQEFFAHCVEKAWLSRASSERGKFRTFLLTCFERFLANQQKRHKAIKRGGGMRPVSIDSELAESRLDFAGSESLSPAEFFDRAWAYAVLENTLQQLREEYKTAKNIERFELLKLYLLTSGELPTYDELAAKLGTTPNASKVAVHRLRKRFRDIVRAEVADSLDVGGDVDEEIGYLIKLLS